MKNVIIKCLAVIAILSISIYLLNANSGCCLSENNSNPASSQDELHSHWTVTELSDSLAKTNNKQLIFMHKNSMQGTYIELDKGTSFNRKADNDDLYYLYAGSCKIQLDNDKLSFNQGDIIYVKKGSKLTIDESDENLQLVITSMFLNSNSAKPMWKHFSKRSIESPRKSKENVWNPFIMYSNIMLGMYMLPHDLDGDQRLVHEWQELNIVTSGSSTFIMDSGSIEVEEGSIFFVEEGNGHYFEKLQDDIDILILWEMRNVDHSNH